MYNLTHRHDEPRRASPFKGTRHAAASLQLFMKEHTQKARSSSKVSLVGGVIVRGGHIHRLFAGAREAEPLIRVGKGC